jgi:uncharacterized protein (DUF1697 family)
MTAYVALLRSVNVAGHGRLAMADLKASFVALGYDDVSTFIQTGNVLFRSPSKSMPKLIATIEEQLEADFGASPAVLLRTVPDLTRVVATSPFAKKGADPARHHVTFLAKKPTSKQLAEFKAPASGRDELEIIGQEVYVHTPDGYAGSKLTGTLIERRLGMLSTTRNWNSVTKLCALAGG